MCQATLFDACRPVVDALLESYNGTIMAYGQTGSGKTHSLFGTTQQPGIVPQVIRTLLQQLGNATLRMSVVELYCERIRDLLQGRDNLAIATDRERGVYIVDASEVEVRDDEEALKTVQVALGRRAVAATNMNERSSRSHCMVTLTLTKRCRGGHRISKLCLVDLAGTTTGSMVVLVASSGYRERAAGQDGGRGHHLGRGQAHQQVAELPGQRGQRADAAGRPCAIPRVQTHARAAGFAGRQRAHDCAPLCVADS